MVHIKWTYNKNTAIPNSHSTRLQRQGPPFQVTYFLISVKFTSVKCIDLI